ncbi:UDP-glucose pyrophosphorylase 2 [Pelomyxa schiedti]|nr:UDP-glucose pyrophosphorylase 2 [Pelomyxa schiedti]
MTTSAVDAMNEALRQLSSTAQTEQHRLSFERECIGFTRLFARFQSGENPTIEWDKIRPPPSSMLRDYTSLPPVDHAQVASFLNKVVIVKLNGGLGTTMGCTGPKSIIEAHAGKSFLEITFMQTQYLNEKYGVTIPLVLMNSFSTHADTMKLLSKYSGEPFLRLHTFMQSQHPRFDFKTLLPLAKTLNGPESDWYPPGHGDFYRSFMNSGLLEAFLSEGKEYAFVSNIDNLGATVDPVIVKFLSETNMNFSMELTEKTRADVKGGTLISYDDRPRLLEIAQVPPAHVPEFASLKKFKIFNTNNLWVKLSAMKPAIDSGAIDNLDIIVNKKAYPGGTLVQLETAMCAAVQAFPNACGITVPRSRFLPVKTVNDLLITQSNLYLMHDGLVVAHPDRQFPLIPPTVRLGDFFKKVGDYAARVPSIPNLLELDHLTVSGDVYFGSKIVLKGTVIIVAPPGHRLHIPDGATYENKVITLNCETNALVVLEHC